jgi:hypothetical protein
MILYHFTAVEYLPDIAADGLSRGEVPLTPDRLLNAVWLTSDQDFVRSWFERWARVDREGESVRRATDRSGSLFPAQARGPADD